MGILNVTPDSFSDGGKFADPTTAITHAKYMVAEGASIIDIGGESTRPGAAPLSDEEELARILPVIKQLIKDVSVPLSIDTTKPKVAEECLRAGAHLINDITGLSNPRMREVIAQYHVPAIIMHMQGTPQTMQHNPTYTNVISEIKTFFQERINLAHKAGISTVIIDPGIGFGKTLEHNLQILKHLHTFTTLHCPLLVGPSRKSFIGAITGLPVNERLEGTLAAVSIAALNGAHILRVHDVKECHRVLQIIDAIRGTA